MDAVNTGIQTQAINCMLVTGGYLFAGTVLNGLFRSADHGNTWIDVNQNLLTQSFIHAMVYSGNRLMVEADNYIFYTTDFGMTWDIDQGPTAFYVIHDFFAHGDTVLASSFNTIFRTTDGGVTWSNPYLIGRTVVDFDNINDTIYAGTTEGMLISID